MIDRFTISKIVVLFIALCGMTFRIVAQESSDSIIQPLIFQSVKPIQVSTPLSQDEKKVADFTTENLQFKTLPNGELLIKAALFLVNTPYVAGTLEINDEESLVVNLREIDCTTLVENCIALTRSLQSEFPGMETFERELRTVRYRKGAIDGYTSRLHYITDWITDNSEKGILEDITHAIAGRRMPVHVNYMSTHPEAYKSLSEHPEEVNAIRKIEASINSRNYYYYIPKQEIRDKQQHIKNGDIICFTTSIEGLDVSHMGIAYWDKGVLSFIHASSKAGKVIINPDSLVDYCTKLKSNTGIIVLSINGPAQMRT